MLIFAGERMQNLEQRGFIFFAETRGLGFCGFSEGFPPPYIAPYKQGILRSNPNGAWSQKSNSHLHNAVALTKDRNRNLSRTNYRKIEIKLESHLDNKYP